jgi:predicted ribosomally synthesized peptide with nif11-like leader
MSDEAMTQADLFLEHAMKDSSVMDRLKSGKWADIEATAKSLDYNFTRQEFREAAAELLEDELEDEQLERISGGLTDDEESDIVDIIGGLGGLGG